MLRVAIVEDDQTQAEQLQSFVRSWADKKFDVHIDTFIPSNFMSCHRSYIMNMDYVKYFAGKDVCLTNNKLIPIAVKYMA